MSMVCRDVMLGCSLEEAQAETSTLHRRSVLQLLLMMISGTDDKHSSKF